MCRRGVSSPLSSSIRRLLKMKPHSIVDFVYRHFRHKLGLIHQVMLIYRRSMSQIVLLTLDEAAARLRCTVAKVQRLCLDGDLTFLPGRPLLVPEEALNAYITGKLQLGKKSSTPAIADNRTDEDKAYAEAQAIIADIIKRNNGKLRMTPDIVKLLAPFENRPEVVAARNAVRKARHNMLQREDRIAEKKALALAMAEKAGRNPNEKPKRRRTKARKPRSKRPQSKRSVAPTGE